MLFAAFTQWIQDERLVVAFVVILSLMSHFSFHSSHEISLDQIYATRICIFVSLNNRTPEFSLPLTKIRRPHVSFYRKTRCIFVLKCSRTSPKIHSEQRTNFVEFRLHYFCTVL